MATRHFRHLQLRDRPDSMGYTNPRQPKRKPGPALEDPASHGESLLEQYADSWADAIATQIQSNPDRKGVYLEFRGAPGKNLNLKSLENMAGKDAERWLRLLNVRTLENLPSDDSPQSSVQGATVFIPRSREKFLLNKLQKYYDDARVGSDSLGNKHLAESIQVIKNAIKLQSFWTDDVGKIPGAEKTWCEVWISSDSTEAISYIEASLKVLAIDSKEGVINFPERAVKLIHASESDLAKLILESDSIAEFRSASTTADFWKALSPVEQREWAADLRNRTKYSETGSLVVCILDTGVNNGHPLLEPVLADDDLHTLDQKWQTHDHSGHGTLMAGVAAYGNLLARLENTGNEVVSHCLESVKIVPSTGQNPVQLWGYLTQQGVSLVEIQAPERNRILCMAVSAPDSIHLGRPSSWSAAVDDIASGTDGGPKRLVVLAAGNVNATNWMDYREVQYEQSIHDPAQSWNALTIGDMTELARIQAADFADYHPAEPAGGLSPFSTTTLSWPEKAWPNKPDIVLEGGNLAVDSAGNLDECDDLCRISTHYRPYLRHFEPFHMTSHAAAEAAWMAAEIQNFYPEFWPETLRGLLVHSARWTDAQRSLVDDYKGKAAMARLIRICGYGTPDLDRAMRSAENSLTIVAQQEIQPFTGGSTKELHLYNLPLPADILRDLPFGTEIEMRVTLSYFIEPGPGERGWKNRYSYASHGLRFDLIAPTESREDFVKRKNKQALAENESAPTGTSTSEHWEVGETARNRGSIHSDIWRGSPQQLAESDILMVYPTFGWWRERTKLGRSDSVARYSLLISIETPSEEVQLYTSIAQRIGISPEVIVET